MKTKKKIRKVNKENNKQLDILSQAIEQYFMELEMQREQYKLWWREMYRAYMKKHPEKIFHQRQ